MVERILGTVVWYVSLNFLYEYGIDKSTIGDYHTNINLQMNLWGSEATGLGGLLDGTWRHMLKTWAPRGAETAKTLYGAEGWVIHNELNIFGSTG